MSEIKQHVRYYVVDCTYRYEGAFHDTCYLTSPATGRFDASEIMREIQCEEGQTIRIAIEVAEEHT